MLASRSQASDQLLPATRAEGGAWTLASSAMGGTSLYCLYSFKFGVWKVYPGLIAGRGPFEKNGTLVFTRAADRDIVSS